MPSYGLVRRQQRRDVQDVYQVVMANQAAYPVRAMCRLANSLDRHRIIDRSRRRFVVS